MNRNYTMMLVPYTATEQTSVAVYLDTLFWREPIRISTIQTEIFRSFPQDVKANVWIGPSNRP